MRGIASIDGGPARPCEFSQGDLALTPGGVSTHFNLPAGRFIQIVQNPATYDTLISEIVRGDTVQFEPQFPFNNLLVSQIVSTLAHEVESGFLDHILVDALNTALAVRIVRHSIDPSKLALAPCNGLSRERLQRVRTTSRHVSTIG